MYVFCCGRCGAGCGWRRGKSLRDDVIDLLVDRYGGACGWRGRSLKSTSGGSGRKTRRRLDSRPSKTNGGRGFEQNKRRSGLRAEQTVGGA